MSLTLFLASKTAKDYKRETSTFTVRFPTPIQIPRDAKECYVKVLQADIWNLVPNVSPSLGNTITVQPGGVGPEVTLTITTGQYSFDALSSSISNELLKAQLSADVLTIGANAATQKVTLKTAAAGTVVKFVGASSMFKILGFEQDTSTTLADAGVEYSAPNIAQFNVINAFLIHSDLVGDGIPINGEFTQTIAKVPITVRSGSLITYTPAYPISVPAPGLIGNTRSQVLLYLTSEDGSTLVDTQEDYSVLLEISYN